MFTGNSINETEKKLKYTNLSEGRFYIGTKDVGFDHEINYDNGVRIPFDADKFRIAPPNSILLCIEGGSAGRKIAFTNQTVCFGNKLCCFISYEVDSRYIYYYLQSPIFQSAFKNNITGIIGGVSVNTLKDMLLPIPPISEQYRIVKEVDKFKAFIIEYDKKDIELGELNKSFPDQLKKSILQEAVQGKLVPQDPNDEPASVLLERIRAEKERLIAEGKIKRDKHESRIFKRDNSHYELRDGVEVCIDDEIPFEIPDSWEWIRLPTIASLCLGKMLDKQKNRGVSCSYLRNVNVRWGAFDLSDLLNMKFEDPDDSRFLIEYNDLVMCEGGEPGRCAIWNSKQPIHFQKALHRIRFWSNINVQFFQYVFTYYSQTHFFSNLFTGSTIKHLTGMALEKVLVPLPPMHEQKRVVLKLDAVLPLCHNNVQL